MSTEQQTRDEPKCISREDFYKLTGLLVVQRAALQITQEDGDPDLGHTCDAIYQDYSAIELLEKLSIEVEGSTDE